MSDATKGGKIIPLFRDKEPAPPAPNIRCTHCGSEWFTIHACFNQRGGLAGRTNTAACEQCGETLELPFM